MNNLNNNTNQELVIINQFDDFENVNLDYFEISFENDHRDEIMTQAAMVADYEKMLDLEAKQDVARYNYLTSRA